MRTFLGLAFFLFSLNFAYQIPTICIDPALDLVINTDCSDLRIYKLKEDLCETVYQPISIDPHITDRHFFWGIDSLGFPLASFSKEQLASYPVISAIITTFCPDSTKKEDLLNLGFPNIFDQKQVYLAFLDGSHLKGIENKDDGTSQFFDEASDSKEFEFDQNPNLKISDLVEFYPFLKNLTDIQISAAKLYWRFTAYLPIDKVQIEMENARKNPKTYTPNLWWSFEYMIMKRKVDGDNKIEVRHEILELCLEKKTTKETFHFVIDRAAKYLPIFRSKIRVIYTGSGDGCNLESKKWSNVRAGFYNTNKPQLTVRESKQNLNYSFMKVLNIGVEYLLNYPVFNTLYNCQHFATNVFDTISSSNLDFESWKIMLAHSIYSPLNGTKLPFIGLMETK